MKKRVETRNEESGLAKEFLERRGANVNPGFVKVRRVTPCGRLPSQLAKPASLPQKRLKP